MRKGGKKGLCTVRGSGGEHESGPQGLVEDISPLVEQLCEQQGHDTTKFYANRPKSAAEDLIASQTRHEEKITLSIVSST